MYDVTEQNSRMHQGLHHLETVGRTIRRSIDWMLLRHRLLLDWFGLGGFGLIEGRTPWLFHRKNEGRTHATRGCVSCV